VQKSCFFLTQAREEICHSKSYTTMIRARAFVVAHGACFPGRDTACGEGVKNLYENTVDVRCGEEVSGGLGQFGGERGGVEALVVGVGGT
jgi:hypothetical protein